MNLSPVFLQQFKNAVERILHVKGNYSGGILEMALIIDHSLEKEAVVEYVPQLLRSLKMHSEVFRNVRLNVVDWKDDDVIQNTVSPMAMVMLASYYDKYEKVSPSSESEVVHRKTFSRLIQYLKLFQARSKVIILVTDGSYDAGNAEEMKKAMQPFLDKKFMQVVIHEDELKVLYR